MRLEGAGATTVPLQHDRSARLVLSASAGHVLTGRAEDHHVPATPGPVAGRDVAGRLCQRAFPSPCAYPASQEKGRFVERRVGRHRVPSRPQHDRAVNLPRPDPIKKRGSPLKRGQSRGLTLSQAGTADQRQHCPAEGFGKGRPRGDHGSEGRVGGRPPFACRVTTPGTTPAGCGSVEIVVGCGFVTRKVGTVDSGVARSRLTCPCCHQRRGQDAEFAATSSLSLALAHRRLVPGYVPVRDERDNRDNSRVGGTPTDSEQIRPFSGLLQSFPACALAQVRATATRTTAGCGVRSTTAPGSLVVLTTQPISVTTFADRAWSRSA